MVERRFCKADVAGSNPVSGSSNKTPQTRCFVLPGEMKMPQEIGVFLCEVESSQTPKRGPNDMKEEHRIVTARLEDQNQEQEICQKFWC